MTLDQRNDRSYMKENIEKIKEVVLSIAKSSISLVDKLNEYNNFLGGLNPLENSEGMALVCDAAIFCADKIGKTEMVAQLYLIKAKAEVSKGASLIKEMKELTLALGWFAFALKSEKERYDELEKGIQEIWARTQMYINAGFEYLKKNPYVGPAGYCQKMTGEIYATFYLQLKLYHLSSGRPWKARVANYRIMRFLDLDDLFLLDKKSRDRVREVKRDCLICFRESIKYYKQEKAWNFLADCYISLSLEYHSFNSPIRSRIFLSKAQRLIKTYKINDLDKRLKSVKSMPFIGTDLD